VNALTNESLNFGASKGPLPTLSKSAEEKAARSWWRSFQELVLILGLQIVFRAMLALRRLNY
jgi:hypothetical protein